MTPLSSRLRHLLARRAAMLAIAQRAPRHSDVETEARRLVDELERKAERVRTEMERNSTNSL